MSMHVNSMSLDPVLHLELPNLWHPGFVAAILTLVFEAGMSCSEEKACPEETRINHCNILQYSSYMQLPRRPQHALHFCISNLHHHSFLMILHRAMRLGAVKLSPN